MRLIDQHEGVSMGISVVRPDVSECDASRYQARCSDELLTRVILDIYLRRAIWQAKRWSSRVNYAIT
jgi:hypothetical protein